LLIFDYRSVDEQNLIALVLANMEWTRREVERVDRQARSTPIAGAVYHGRSIVGLDEGWSWAQVPVLAGEVQTWARQGRAYGAAFMVVSQDPEDFAGDADAVLRNASIRIFHQLDKGMLAFVRDTVDLSAEMTDSLKSLRKVAGRYSEALIMNARRRARLRGPRCARVLGLDLGATDRRAPPRTGDRRPPRRRVGRAVTACQRRDPAGGGRHRPVTAPARALALRGNALRPRLVAVPRHASELVTSRLGTSALVRSARVAS
jgi:hypothetical protein